MIFFSVENLRHPVKIRSSLKADSQKTNIAAQLVSEAGKVFFKDSIVVVVIHVTITSIDLLRFGLVFNSFFCGSVETN